MTKGCDHEIVRPLKVIRRPYHAKLKLNCGHEVLSVKATVPGSRSNSISFTILFMWVLLHNKL